MKKLSQKIIALALTLAMILSLTALCAPASAAVTYDAKILSIGNSITRDSVYLLGKFAAVGNKNLLIGSLEGNVDDGIREHAHNAILDETDCTYYVYHAGDTDGMTADTSVNSIASALTKEHWDYIILQQDLCHAGFPHAFQNDDMEYLLDYLHANEPGAKIYWNMTWAYQQDLDQKNVKTNKQANHFKEYYDFDQIAMYNAIRNTLENEFIPRYWQNKNDGRYDAAHKVDGIIYTGAAIQYARTMRFNYQSSVWYGEQGGDFFCASDGYHLSAKTGRLLAAATCYRTLFPDAYNASYYTVNSVKDNILNGAATDNSWKNNSGWIEYLINRPSLLASGCGSDPAAMLASSLAQNTVAPDKSGVYYYGTLADFQTEPANTYEGLTVQQVAAPLKLHFPDVAVTDNGDVFSCAYEACYHFPAYHTSTSSAPMESGVGQIRIYKSTDNGVSFTPLPLVIDQDYLEANGIADISNRYNRVKNGTVTAENAIVICDPRDPNLTAGLCDINGDGVKEDVLFLTFWIRNYKENTYTTGGTFLLYSTDHGATWSNVNRMNRTGVSSFGLKRGDITIFDDSHILIPTYSGYQPVVSEWYFDNQGKMQYVDGSRVNLPPTKDEAYIKENEYSVVSPNGGDTVYGFVRSSGGVYRSTDRGRTWTEIDNEFGEIQQPGFCILDNHRVFTSWVRASSPRFVYGKVYDTYATWNDSETNLLYSCSDATAHDMGDPSCATLSDGNVLTVAYDTYYRSIVGVVSDPNADSFALIDEMQESANTSDISEGKFEEDFETAALGAYARAGATVDSALRVVQNGSTKALSCVGEDETDFAAYTLKYDVEGTHTIQADVISPNGAGFFIKTVFGDIELYRTRLFVAGSQKNLTLTANKLTHVKVRVLGNTETAGLGTLQVKVWQSGSEPDEWTKEITANSLSSGPITFGGTTGTLIESLSVTQKLKIAPEIFGLISGNSMKAEYTGLLGTQIALTPNVQPVQSLAWESEYPHIASVDQNGVVSLLWEGTTTITCRTPLGASKTTTVTVLPASPEISQYGTLKTDCSDDFSGTLNAYDLTNGPTLSSDRLLLPKPTDGKVSDIFTKSKFEGELTFQFDFYNPGGNTFYTYLFTGNGVDNMNHTLQFTDGGLRFDVTGNAEDYSETFLKEELLANSEDWMTVKIARTASCICFKLWKQGTSEPEYWQYSYIPTGDAVRALAQAVASGHSAQFGFKNASGSGDLYIDNLSITHFEAPVIPTPDVSPEITQSGTLTAQFSDSFSGAQCSLTLANNAAVSDGALLLPKNETATAFTPSNDKITGDATLQFDFYNLGGTFYVYLFEGCGVNNIFHTIQVTSSGIRFDTTGSVTGYSPYFFASEISAGMNRWLTLKIARTATCIKFKLWQQGESEPSDWQYTYTPATQSARDVLSSAAKNTHSARFGFKNVSAKDLRIDNFSVTSRTAQVPNRPSIQTFTHDGYTDYVITNADAASHAIFTYKTADKKLTYTKNITLSGGTGFFSLDESILPNYTANTYTVFLLDDSWKPVSRPLPIQ